MATIKYDDLSLAFDFVSAGAAKRTIFRWASAMANSRPDMRCTRRRTGRVRAISRLTVGIYLVTTIAGALGACALERGSVPLRPEESAIVRVGQIATLQVPRGMALVGSAGTALAMIRQTKRRDATLYSYRADKVGNQTFVLAPAGLQDGQCVSCVTEHYFVRVVE